MFLFADGFDYYGSPADMAARWPLLFNNTNLTFVTGASTAFGTGQGLRCSSTNAMVMGQAAFLSGTNETTIYGSLRYMWSSPTSSATSYVAVQLLDGTTQQVTLMFMGDGSIVARSGGGSGAVLGSAPAGTFPINSWNSFQFKVVIDPTAGSVEVRMNGSATAVLNLTGKNTRGGTTTTQVNGCALSEACPGSGYNLVDDFFLCSGSGAAPNTWPGDVRAIQQTPVGQTQAQFIASPSSYTTASSTGVSATNGGKSANTIYAYPLTVPASGATTQLQAVLGAALTGHLAMALYDNAGVSGGPGALLGSTATAANPAAGALTLSLTAPIAATKGQGVWIAIMADAAFTLSGDGGGHPNFTNLISQSFTSGFPASLAASSPGSSNAPNIAIVTVPTNVTAVSEATGDGDASYVYSATPGQEDIYTLAAVPTDYSVIGVEYYVDWKKSDAGARAARLSVQANGSADTALISNAALSSSYTYQSKFLATDPTGAAWTPATANGAKIGISVTA